MGTQTSTEEYELVEEWEESEDICFICRSPIEFRLLWRTGLVAPDVETKCPECGWDALEKALM